jgi:hypothetical protein
MFRTFTVYPGDFLIRKYVGKFKMCGNNVKCSRVVYSECPDHFAHNVTFSVNFGNTFGKCQEHFECSLSSCLPDIYLQFCQSVPKNFPKCPNLVCDGHMTWYIARNIQNKPLKHALMAFYWNIQNILVNFWFGTLWSHDLVYSEHT